MTKDEAIALLDKLSGESLDAIVEVIGSPRQYNNGKSAMRVWFLSRLARMWDVPYPPPKPAETEPVADTDRQSPSEVAAVLEAAADHAGAYASTFRQLAARLAAPSFRPLDIEKALRHAYGRGVDDARQDAGREPLGLAGWLRRRDAWIQQYVARLPGGSDA